MDIIFGGVSDLNIRTNYKGTYRWLAKFYVTTLGKKKSLCDHKAQANKLVNYLEKAT